MPVPPVPDHQLTVAPAPLTPFAVNVVVAFEQIGLAAAVADVIAGIEYIVTVCVAVAGPLQPAALAVIILVPLHPAA